MKVKGTEDTLYFYSNSPHGIYHLFWRTEGKCYRKARPFKQFFLITGYDKENAISYETTVVRTLFYSVSSLSY